jgi:hypothetical protein
MVRGFLVLGLRIRKCGMDGPENSELAHNVTYRFSGRARIMGSSPL